MLWMMNRCESARWFGATIVMIDLMMNHTLFDRRASSETWNINCLATGAGIQHIEHGNKAVKFGLRQWEELHRGYRSQATAREKHCTRDAHFVVFLRNVLPLRQNGESPIREGLFPPSESSYPDLTARIGGFSVL
jgi:hypothetical protein